MMFNFVLKQPSRIQVEYIFCIVMRFWKIQEWRLWIILVLCFFLSSGSCFTHPSCPLCPLLDSPYLPLLSWNMPHTDSFTRCWSCSWEPQLTLQPCTCGPNTLQLSCCKVHTTTVSCTSGSVGVTGHVVADAVGSVWISKRMSILSNDLPSHLQWTHVQLADLNAVQNNKLVQANSP